MDQERRSPSVGTRSFESRDLFWSVISNPARLDADASQNRSGLHHQDLLTGEEYVGQTLTPEKRWIQHQQASRYLNTPLYRSMREYGLDAFVFGVHEDGIPAKYLTRFEWAVMRARETHVNGYNCRLRVPTCYQESGVRPLLTPGEVAAALGLEEKKVRMLFGLRPDVFWVGRQLRIPPELVENFDLEEFEAAIKPACEPKPEPKIDMKALRDALHKAIRDGLYAA